MKRPGILSIASAVAILFMLAGCGGGDDDDDDLAGPDGSGYGGFPPAGAWAEHIDHTAYQKPFRLESVGADTLEGKECLLMEYETTEEDQEVVMQIWIEESTGEPAFLFMKQAGQVFRLDPETYIDVVELVSKPETSEETLLLGEGKYMLPDGRTLDIMEYREETSEGVIEFGVSEEVPFGRVVTKRDGMLITSLEDFGTEGASRDISRQEAENAQPL
jgi:hypothetical protein